MNFLVNIPLQETAIEYFRQILPHYRIQETEKDIEVTRTNNFKGMTDKQLKDFQLIQIRRLIDLEGKTTECIERLHKLGLKIVFDIDDYWHIPEYHSMYPQWKENNAAEQVIEALKLVDYVTTTTPYLADKVKEYNKNVLVCENAIHPLEDQWHIKPIPDHRARFGWVGGVYHQKDMELLRESFKRLSKDFPLRKLIQVCSTFSPNHEYVAIEKMMTNDYKFCPKEYADYLKKYQKFMEHYGKDEYYRRLWGTDVNHYAKLYDQIDVALIPLRDDEFNNNKSELKMIEAGFKKKAVIVSDVKPYDLVATDKNCLRVKQGRDFIDWYVHIRKLAINRSMIKELGEQLYEDVKDKYHIDTVNKKRIDLYKSMV